jgi:diacylglycerol O-acyltransferase / wax synthase
MERMSILDSGFYYLEDENKPMHVGSVAVFEGPAPAYGDLVRLLLSKLPRVPRYRQRVREVPFHLGRPVWTDDEHFQILYHVRHTAVPAPGGAEQLRNLAGRVFAQRLDMTKPLWEMWLVEGIAEGRWAIISKTHHCMVDGVAGMDLATVLLEPTPDAEVPAPVDWEAAPAPSAVDLVLGGIRTALGEPIQQLAAVPALARQLPSTQAVVEFSKGLLTTARRLATPSARDLNGPIGPHRRWEWTQVKLDRVKAVRQVFGGTVNDVVLASVTRGFRDLLAGRDRLTTGQVVRTLVPVSVRAPAEKGAMNNRVSGLLVNLPVGEPDPHRRLMLLREQMDDLKTNRQAVGAQALTELAGFAGPTLLAMGSRVTFRYPQSTMQAVTTNVPGPRFPLHMLGRRLVEVYPYVPIAYNLRISIGIFSYLDQLNFGINADFDAVPDVAVLARGINAGLDELIAAAEKATAVAETPVVAAAQANAEAPVVDAKRASPSGNGRAPVKTVKKAARPKATKTVAPKAPARRDDA